jgi:adenylate cyclase
MSTTRRLAAILAADVVGYSRLMGADEEGTLERLKTHRRELIDPKIAEHRGRIVKTTGDGILIEFPSVLDAVRCAVDVQRAMVGRNASEAPDRRIEFRVGINLGDIIIDGDDIHGDGVNIAARLEGISDPGGLCISEDVHRQVSGKLPFEFSDMGEQSLKNIARPVRAYRLRFDERAPSRPVLALPDKPSIAVLPFQNMSGDPEQEYFADGIVEEIITALSRFRQLFVIARNSSFAYKSKSPDIRQVGRELGVRYVLEGSVRKAANRLRITGQLIDASTGAHLWADRFESGLEDVFELQDRVTANVVGAIAPTLEKAEIERAKRKPTDSLDAYDHFLRGMASHNRYFQFASRDTMEEALRHFYRAIELDPGFASAHAMASVCYVLRRANSWMTNPEGETAEAGRLARRAMELGRDDALALCMAGTTLSYVVRDLDTAIALLDRALVLNPNLALAWLWGGYVKLWSGEPDAAIERVARAMRLSPMDLNGPGMQTAMADAHFFAGRYDEASSWAAMSIREAPRHNGLRIVAASNALAGQPELAREAMARLRQLDPTLRISNLRNVQGPYRRPEDIARYEEAMRKAGLPE